MKRLLHACFNEPIPDEEWDRVVSLGFDGARIDAMETFTLEGMNAIVNPCLDRYLSPLVIVSRPEQCELLPQGIDIEVLNEPDIRKHPAPYFNDDPAGYITLVQQVNNAALLRQQSVWAGAPSNLDERGFNWLRAVAPNFPVEVGVSFHRYPESGCGPQEAHQGYRNRSDEMRALRDIIGDRPYGHSEGGFHTAPQSGPWWRLGRKVTWTDDQVASMWTWEWTFLEEQGCAFGTLFQIHDGPNADGESHFGVWRLDGTLKPVAFTVAKT